MRMGRVKAEIYYPVDLDQNIANEVRAAIDDYVRKGMIN